MRALPWLVVLLATVAAADYCSSCTTIVHEIATKGETVACAEAGFTRPPLSDLCDFLVDKLGELIVDKMSHGRMNATTLCRELGMCSGQGCACGQCAAPVFGLRCLSLPNHGPKPLAQPLLGAVKSNVTCVDHACSAATNGCCLTCW